jgi:hypothetical protein
MFDLWYTTGAAITFPEILDEVTAKGNAAGIAAGRNDGDPLFFTIPAIQFSNGGTPNVPILNPNIPNPAAAVAPVIRDSGYIVRDIIGAVRTAIKDSVHKRFPFAPPISLFTAGKFCQLLTVTLFDFKNNVRLANQGYEAAVTNLPAKRSPNFPAFLGVYLMDSSLTGAVSGATGPTTEAQKALAEFGITDPGEMAVFGTLSQVGPFLTAQSNLLRPPLWTSCREQFLLWGIQNDAMVI